MDVHCSDLYCSGDDDEEDEDGGCCADGRCDEDGKMKMRRTRQG